MKVTIGNKTITNEFHRGFDTLNFWKLATHDVCSCRHHISAAPPPTPPPVGSEQQTKYLSGTTTIRTTQRWGVEPHKVPRTRCCVILRPDRLSRSPKKSRVAAPPSISAWWAAASRNVVKLQPQIPPCEEEESPAAASYARGWEPTTPICCVAFEQRHPSMATGGGGVGVEGKG
jgi:hypothetical protein